MKHIRRIFPQKNIMQTAGYVFDDLKYDMVYFMNYKNTLSPITTLPSSVVEVINNIAEQLDDKMAIIKKKKKKSSTNAYNPKVALSSNNNIFKNLSTVGNVHLLTVAQKHKNEQQRFHKELNLALNGLTDNNMNTILSKVMNIFQNYNQSLDKSVIIPIATEHIISKSLMQSIYTEHYAHLLQEIVTTLEYGHELLDNVKSQLESNLKLVELKQMSKPVYRCVCLLYVSLYLKNLLGFDEFITFINYNINKLLHASNEIKEIVVVGIVETFMFIHQKQMNKDIVSEQTEIIKSICDNSAIPMNIRIRLFDIKDVY